MKYSGSYSIPFKDLKDGEYEYSFSLNETFFENIENSEIQTGSVTMEIRLQKASSFLILDYLLEGSVSIMCDRCLENFDSEIEHSEQLKVIFEKTDPGTEEADAIYLSPDEDVLDLTHYIYESILLSLPVQRFHPNIDGKPTCNPDMLKLLEKHSNNNKKDDIDPRWDALKKLK